ncbi:MAG: HPF/RaiA family ribosome-associated protein [Deltaproteobacteria bacterium]|nr:HPF/RaiA family ribosome-associated protein [Deltaproteobacteria bacterium]
MQRPLKITSRDFPLSEAVEAEIREKSAALENYYERLNGCEVTVHAPALKHHHKGGPFLVAIRLMVPGKELTVDHQEEEELSQAIREAFDAARRQLEDYVREQRGTVKMHESMVGHISRLERKLGYGFIETADDREIYFHCNSVLDRAFDRLEVGAEVRFAEEEGEQGPQASTVILTKLPRHEAR